MKHPVLTWAIFVFALALVLGAMGWSSVTVLELHRAQQAAREQANIEERVRLALWRMDSALSPIISQENARPPFLYRPFYPAALIDACTDGVAVASKELTPSPLLIKLPPHVLLHFHFDEVGKLTSPQVPLGGERERAREGCTTLEELNSAAVRLAEFQTVVPWETLLVALGGELPAGRPPIDERRSPNDRFAHLDPRGQTLLNDNEFAARSQNRTTVQQSVFSSLLVTPLGCEPAEALLRPIWVTAAHEGASRPPAHLVLARRVAADYFGEHLQGCWMDWAKLKRSLLDDIGDLLPHADLEPVLADEGGSSSRLLAAVPLRLIPGQIPKGEGSAASPLLLSLGVAWACVLLAVLAVAALLVGVMALSERRAAFVSAVTHELRTPLTTFKMYTEMLAGGLVPDETKRSRYLDTLHREASRLSHLVENVLAFARLEKRRSRAGAAEPSRVDELLERAAQPLRERAAQAGLELRLEREPAVASARVRADAVTVEQILFNLVDNACKYAAGEGRGSVWLEARRAGAAVELAVRDEGPGIAARQARRLFRPFSRSASDAAGSAPGVGLGLALSRRLARALGGDLTLDPACPRGARFVLRLPVVG